MSKETQIFYNKFSFFYPLVNIFLSPQRRVLFNEINELPFGDLLEIGVGPGSHLHLYKTHKVTAIDTSSTMLRLATKRKSSSINLIEMNGEALVFQDKNFDYVVLSYVISVVDNPEQLLKEIFRVLKPGGKLFILNHFTPHNLLKYVDRAFNFIAKYLHFKSFFYINDIAVINQFSLSKEISFGPLSYFKLLIFEKK